jgi:8-oxo-dGTP diphosphatase
MKKTVKVVAAIIENDKNEILCALRSPDMSLANMWEFPGGKVEKNEDIYTAIENTHEYETFIINLLCISCCIIDGTPIPTEHSKLIWLKRENLDSLKWAPADIPAVKQLIKREFHM